MQPSDEAFNRALGVALKAVAASDKLVHEITSLLTSKGYPSEVVQAVIERLQFKKLVDDRRVARQFVASKGDQYGAALIKHKLLARGADESLADEAIAELEDERVRAQNVLRKKYKQPVPPDKAARFLYSRGFEEQTVSSVLCEFQTEPG